MTSPRHFLLPDLGEGLTEAEVVAWHVAPGDVVTLNQVLADVETEKAVVELPSPYAGTVIELLAQPGDTVEVGAPLIAIASGEADAQAAPTEPAEERVSVLVGYGPSEAPPSRRRRRGGAHRDRLDAPSPPPGAPVSTPEPTRPLAAPPVRYMARQNGVDLAEVTGHGPGGIVTREDLASHLEHRLRTEPIEGRETRAPVRGVQKHMAEAMVRSIATAPQACVFLTIDVTSTVELVQRLRANRHFEGLRVTPLALAARAVVLALEQYPALNASWDDATNEVVTKHYVNLGIAVAGPHGLIVPNIKDAQVLTLRQLVEALGELTTAARAARATPEDLRGGTLTITNVGTFGVDTGVPILNPGEGAILAVGAIDARPWAHEGAVALRQVMTLSLAFDHRLVDGQAASLFLSTVGEMLADPTNLLALS
jgi:2-oxoisovalerate dehydrogenase E2 component (dihydrolipoyl transacylase)